ncbi:MAG TPA: acyl-CoA dehydrogenase family protein, partial [Acidimicrobiia bacterium]|nr:acyl-CoA dehydrogenase family protein [Acidimicrobiia bacterium]
MDFEFSEEQEAVRASVRRFIEERAPVAWVRDRYDDPRGTTDEVWRGLADLGVLGLLVPEAHGGAGGGMVDAALVLETLGRAVHPGPYASSAIGAVGLVLDAGTADDHAELLPGLAAGSSVATVALLEPNRRAEWRNPTTTARADGAAWRLDGAKAHVPDLLAARFVLAIATDEAGALGVFAVEADADGATIE